MTLTKLAESEWASNPIFTNGVGWIVGFVIGAAVVWLMSRSRRPPIVAEPPKPTKPSGAPLRLLALLQREGRLVDFLMEDVQAASDEQIGAAVREIHRGCRKALQEHLTLEPVMAETEGAEVTIPVGFDPATVRLTGNVTGQPPFKGALRHHGWRVREMKLAPPPEGQDEFVIQAAEVELP